MKDDKIPKYNDAVGIRATLNSMGIPNEKIGYNEATKTVTLNGKDFMKPSYMDEDNGISYAPASEIRKNVVNFYKDSNNPVVRVSDSYSSAAGKYGLSADALSFGDGTVLIGGKPVSTLYIDDEGKAWAWQNDVFDSVKDYANRVNVKNPNSLAENINNSYLDDIYEKLYEISNREEFSYNPENDPVYKAYHKKYLTEGDRATRDAIADFSALTGGYANSSAITAGSLAGQYYSQQLVNKIPELASQAYERYVNSYNTDLGLVTQMLSTYDKIYDNTMSSNDFARAYANDTAHSIKERDKTERETSWDEKERQQNYNIKENEYNWTNIFNQQKEQENKNKIKEGNLDIIEKETFLEYYRRILDNQLRESDAKIFSLYN